MNENEYLEGCRLMAEFLGLELEETLKGEFVYARKEQNPLKLNDIKTEFYAPEDLKYHYDWNWIMPVVEKIDQIGASVIIGRMFCEIKYINPLNEKQHFEIRIASGVKMNAVNGAVIEFIKWYNKNK